MKYSIHSTKQDWLDLYKEFEILNENRATFRPESGRESPGSRAPGGPSPAVRRRPRGRRRRRTRSRSGETGGISPSGDARSGTWDPGRKASPAPGACRGPAPGRRAPPGSCGRGLQTLCAPRD